MSFSDAQFRHFKLRLTETAAALVCLLALSACSIGSVGGGGGGSSNEKAVAPYCPYLPSKTFSSAVTITGSAFYEYRTNGNGNVTDSIHTLTPSAGVLNDTYTLKVNSHATTSYSCPTATCTAASVVTALTSVINGDSTFDVTASGTSTLVLTPKSEGTAISVTTLVKFTDSAHSDPNPIRYAEIQVTDASGAIVQCAETDSTGSFSFQLPSGGGTYTVAVVSRSNNSSNTGYVLDTPTNNTPYSITTSVTASSNQTIRLIASATGDLKGGAFNILDQIYNSQNYLRTQTANCGTSSSSNYFADCDPFVTAPVVYTYWSPGVNPGTYVGTTGGLSFYLNGTNKLYILGGINGDVDNSDMDHFDNSVIIHEYGHFIEDNFGRPDSPGGSHNGNSIIDPRLAWGEGWSNFFQAAVRGDPYYRDTYGHTGCTGSNAQGLSGCTGTTFNESLTSATMDVPSIAGEGNFREFSISRTLYTAIVGGPAKFSEIWTVLHGPSSGFKSISDRFKSIGRFHKIEQAISGAALWSTIRSNEFQTGDLSNYATPVKTTCGSTSITMSGIRKTVSDDGSFSKSDQLRNNDFYSYTHPGGALSITLSWSGGSSIDMDLYLYKEAYTYGSTSSIILKSDTTSKATTGTESISASVAAGNYMINVMAYTGSLTTGTYNTTYTLTINGTAVCADP